MTQTLYALIGCTAVLGGFISLMIATHYIIRPSKVKDTSKGSNTTKGSNINVSKVIR